MYCPNCSVPVTAYTASCPECGADFSPGSAWKPVARPPVQPRPSFWRPGISRWLLIGAAYGVLMRGLFHVVSSTAHEFQGPMSLAFLVGTPLAVGAITVYGSSRARSSLPLAFVEPIPAMTLMMIGTAVSLLEGSICIAIMAPMFYVLACLGGLCMGLAFKVAKLARPTVGAFALLPLLLIPVEGPLPHTFHVVREKVVVRAPPEVVWANIEHATDIRRDELPLSITHVIGVPRPVDARNTVTAAGETRLSKWEKGVHFTAAIVRKTPGESITWRYSFAPDSFPPGTMDEHVVLGGKYLDLGDTTFNLKPVAQGTELEVIGRYRLSTPVNAYAIPVSKFLGHDFLRMLLGFYKARSESITSTKAPT